MTTLERVKQLVRELPVEERKQVVMDILDSLAHPQAEQKTSLLELEGLGAEIWAGVDAAEYVDTLRRELSMNIEKTHNILDFEGIGAHLYDGSDAQNDVDTMRADWDARP